jgi:hypothetical protein
MADDFLYYRDDIDILKRHLKNGLVELAGRKTSVASREYSEGGDAKMREHCPVR